MTPVEHMLEQVAWKKEDNSSNDDKLPYVTHSGVFSIGGLSLRCYRLNTGQKIIDAEDMNKFFEPLHSLED